MEGGKRKLAADTDPSHYFEYLNWHPYIHEKHTLSWLAMNESLYGLYRLKSFCQGYNSRYTHIRYQFFPPFKITVKIAELGDNNLSPCIAMINSNLIQ